MPRLIPFRLAAACTLALAFTVLIAATAAAKGIPAQLRVVAGQKVLADKALRTGTTAVPTSHAATCFGKDKGGSGKNVRIPGPTALGLLAQGARSTRSLRPLLVTDAFSFGLGLCAIGGIEASGEGFWQLRVNHKSSEVGGDSVKLRRGDSVLWYLTPSFEASTAELWLKAPKRVGSGTPFAVRVFAYDEKGKRKPAAGVSVSGAKQRTNKGGRTMVTLRRPVKLIARQEKYIPSNRVAVCVGGKCPRS
jgi:Domain of unknown function (DUF4430)